MLINDDDNDKNPDQVNVKNLLKLLGSDRE